MTIIALIDGRPQSVAVTPYRRWREPNGSVWLAVTDGRGRHWRIKEVS